MHLNLVQVRVYFELYSKSKESYPIGRGANAKRLEAMRVQQGDFLASGTQMNLLIKLAKPLVPPIEHRLLDDRNLPTTTVRRFIF